MSYRYYLVEDSDTDSFWGIGASREGLNHMGRLWFILRNELLEELKND